MRRTLALAIALLAVLTAGGVPTAWSQEEFPTLPDFFTGFWMDPSFQSSGDSTTQAGWLISAELKMARDMNNGREVRWTSATRKTGLPHGRVGWFVVVGEGDTEGTNEVWVFIRMDANTISVITGPDSVYTLKRKPG